MDQVTALAREAAQLLTAREALAESSTKVFDDPGYALLGDRLEAIQSSGSLMTAVTAEGAAFQLQLLSLSLDRLENMVPEDERHGPNFQTELRQAFRLLRSAETFLRQQAASASIETTHDYYLTEYGEAIATLTAPSAKAH